MLFHYSSAKQHVLKGDKIIGLKMRSLASKEIAVTFLGTDISAQHGELLIC